MICPAHVVSEGPESIDLPIDWARAQSLCITNRGVPSGDAKGVLRALGARVAAPVTGVRGAPPPRTGSPGAVVSWGGVFAASGAAPRRAAARGYSAHDAIKRY